MAEPISIQQLKDASEDAISLAEFINKPENAMIPRRLASDIHSLQYYLEYMKSFAQRSYETYDEMVANASNLSENVSIFVTNDLDATKNGLYTYNGVGFVKGEYQPENAAKEFFEDKLGGLEVFDGKVRAQDVSTVDGSTQDVKNTEFRNELDALPFEGGVLADTFVTVEEQVTGEGALSLRNFNSRTVLTVNSIAELLQVKATSGRAVFVKGSQGGIFIYDSSKSAINDGGLVVNGWVRQLQTPYITPEMFGCKGDGITDDTTGFNKFAAAEHKYKRATKNYELSGTSVFNVYTSGNILDFGGSTISSITPVFSPLEVAVKTAGLTSLRLITGNYDGLEESNTYLNAYSEASGHCELVHVVFQGIIKNLSNNNNVRGTSGMFMGVSTDTTIVDNANVQNVHNINGAAGVSSSTGISVTNFTKFAIINNPVIDGVYTTTTVDADGLSLFEKKGVATTGTALAIVNNPILSQTCGRGIKSQCNLKVRKLALKLKPPVKGVILPNSWRGVDAQFGNLDVDGSDFDFHADCFTSYSDASLFSINPSIDAQGVQELRNITIRGDSQIRYLLQVNTTDCKGVYISNVTAMSPQVNLNILYPVRKSISDTISIKNVVGEYNPNGRLVFANEMVGVCNKLELSNVPKFYYTVDLGKFDKVKLITPNHTYNGVIDYADISTESIFSYITDGSTGGITFNESTQAISSTYARYSHYRYGDIVSFNKDSLLVKGEGNKFYTVQSPAAVIVPDKP